MEIKTGAVRPTQTVLEGWNLIENQYWLFFGMTFVMTLITIAVSMILGTAIGAIAQIISRAVESTSMGAPADFSAELIPQLISQFLSIITTFVVTLLSALMTCGIYLAMSRKASGGSAEFGDLFSGFKFLQPCLIISLIITLIQFAIHITTLLLGFGFGISRMKPEIFAPGGKLDPQVFQTFIPGLIIIALFYVLFSFAYGVLIFFIYQLIADKNLFAFEALTHSIQAGLKNFFGIILLFIIETLIAFAGALICGVGIFFVIPLLMATNFAAYLRVFGRPENFDQHLPPPPPIFGTESNSGFSRF